MNYRTTQSLATGKGYAINPLPDGFATRQGIDGAQYSQYGPLQPLLAVPFYYLGQVVSKILPDAWLRCQEERLLRTVRFYRPFPKEAGDFQGLYPPNPVERKTRLVVSLFNSVVTWLTAWLLFRFSRRYRTKHREWWLLPFVYLLATYALPHARPFYSEALATFFLLLAFYQAHLIQSETRLLPYIWVGIWSGLAVLTRMDSVVALPGIAWLVLARACRDSGIAWIRKLGLPVVGLIPFLILCAVLPLMNYLRFGGFLATGYADQPEGIEFNTPLLHSLYIYLLSPGKGLFWYSPPLLAGLLGMFFLWKKDRHLSISIILVFLGYLLVIGRWQNLGGWTWGPRHLFQVTPFLLLPMLWLFSSRRSEVKIFFGITFLWGVLVQGMGVLVDFMWPLDQYLYGLPPGQDTRLILSLPFYGPLLHWRAWRMDPDIDWLLMDLWCSGIWMARGMCLVVWGVLLVSSFSILNILLKRSSQDKNIEGLDKGADFL